MTWIKTIAPTPENTELMQALEQQAALYPQEYRPSDPEKVQLPDIVKESSVVLSHSLLPRALHHAFSTFGVLMDPELPLTRAQHEMIATTVSSLNRCFY